MALLAASGEPSWTAGGDGLAGDHAEGCSDGSAHVPLGQPKDVLRVSEARLEGEKDRLGSALINLPRILKSGNLE